MKTIIHYYDYWLDGNAVLLEYESLFEKLTNKGLECCVAVSSGNHDFMQKIKALDGKEVEFDLTHIFNNQWNTVPIEGVSNIGLRVHDWYEAAGMNYKRKCGYWLEQTDEMKQLRANTYRCGYCAAKYFQPKFKWCQSCYSSRYITVDFLPSLYLVPLSLNDKQAGRVRAKLAKVPQELIDAFTKANTEMFRKYHEDMQNSKLAQIQSKMRAIEVEYEIFKTLIDSGVLTETSIDIDNVIYYDHSQQVCFGWRNSLSEQKRKALMLKLDEIGFTKKYVVTFK